MPKGFLVKRVDNMNDLVPYRPWCEEIQEKPVDFSLKRKDDSEIGVRCFVRTPDSGFNSPSGGDLRKSGTIPYDQRSPYHTDPYHHEQTAPIPLLKKKSNEEEPKINFDFASDSMYSPVKNNFFSSPMNPLQLLSSALYLQRNHNLDQATLASLVSSCASGQFTRDPITDLTQPSSPIRTPVRSVPKTPEPTSVTPVKRKTPSAAAVTPDKKPKSAKKSKVSRKLNFDEDKTSPVSGTIIKELEDGEEPLVIRKGDIDPEYNFVEVTEEAKAELSKIENKIGDYVCRLCKELYDDAFSLAQHRCSRIIHVEYRCPECDKVFNCPANLASHRRWHKPKGSPSSLVKNSKFSSTKDNQKNETTDIFLESDADLDTSPDEKEGQFKCNFCNKKFKRESYLHKHEISHHEPKQSLQIEQQKVETFSPMPSFSSMLHSPPFSGDVFHCNYCTLTFLSMGSLHLHIASSHRPEIESKLQSYSEKSLLGSYNSLLHRPSQILAPS